MSELAGIKDCPGVLKTHATLIILFIQLCVALAFFIIYAKRVTEDGKSVHLYPIDGF